MEPSRWKALRSALEELVEVPAAARAAALDRIAGDDERLRAELERLLPTWDKAPDLEPPRPLDATAKADLGRRVGPWVLERELGVGGMGHVFLARRAEGGFEQRVALKLIRRGLDTDKVLRRFERERALLARLAHLGIAQLHDGGATADGLPWFAMEYVQGEPIDRWCATHHAGARERVELFLKVAAAVQHAHGHLIVHRDIKPSNILVSDGGLPKLLDFGIAKALEEDADEAPALTATGERILTPLYASPEQWHGEPATIASDVYALGVVLYELLAGEPPRSRDELWRLERERDWPAPERPSTRLSDSTRLANSTRPSDSTGQSDSTRLSEAKPQSGSTRLGVDTRALARKVSGDLDLIVLKALHTDPRRRYPTVESFAADLQRWLDGRPVEARADSLGYRARQFVRRNKLAVGAVTAVVLGLTAGLVLAIAGWKDALVAHGQATAAQIRAQNETAKLLQLAARQDMQDLETEADALWPLQPALLPRLEAWMSTAERLVRDEPKHRATLGDLDRKDLEAVALDEQERNWWRRQLQEHLADLAAFTDPEKGLFVDAANLRGVGIPRRAALIRAAMTSIAPGSDGERAWVEARAWVKSRPEYAGYELPVLFGMVPIGPDPASGLLELSDVLTGDVARRLPDGKLDFVRESGIVFVLLPGGVTTVGAQNTDLAGEHYDPDADDQETPAWHLRLDPFLVSKFELTQDQWLRMEGKQPSNYFSSKPDQAGLLPVEMVSWDECRRVLDHFGLLLPTEIQWEYAARGGTHTPWWCDASSLPTVANLYDLDGRELVKTNIEPEPWHDGTRATNPGLKYPANAFGLHDVVGGVSEWCLDISAPTRMEPSPGRGQRTFNAVARAIRGGSFRNLATKARSSYRMKAAPTLRGEHLGLRPAFLLVEDGSRWGPERSSAR